MSTASIAVARSDIRGRERVSRDEEPVSRLGLPDEASLPPHVKQLYDEFRAQCGFVPNWIRALAINPDTAYRLVTVYRHLFDPTRSRLSAPDRELIAVVTSAANHSNYDVFKHAQALGDAIGDRVKAQRIAQGFRHVRLSPRDQVLAEVVEKLTLEPTKVGEADLARLRNFDFSIEAIAEILEISAFFNYANRLTIALNVVPDDAFFSS
jgi:uncharacterized peroxidase-related enzyme